MGALIGKLLGWVPIRLDTLSPSGGEHTSCVIGPLDLYADFELVWKMLILSLRDKGSVREETDASLKITSNLPGAWVGSPDIDKMCLLEDYCLDKVQGKIYGTVFREIADHHHLAFYQAFEVHRAPLQVEIWASFEGPKHLLTQMRGFCDANLSEIWRRLDLVASSRPPQARMHRSPSDPRQMSIVVDNLGEFLSFEQLWAEWIDVIKYPEGIRLEDVHTVSDCEFTVDIDEDSWLVHSRPKGQAVRQRVGFHHDQERGEIVSTMGSPPVLTSCTKIHREPLLIEAQAHSWIPVSDGAYIEICAHRFWDYLQKRCSE